MEDEPRSADVAKLLNFKVHAVHARTSILGFVDILRAQGEGYVKQGEESTDLGIQDNETQNLPQGAHGTTNSNEDATNAVPQQNKQTQPTMFSLSAPIPSQSVSQGSGLGSGSLSQQTFEGAIHDSVIRGLRPHIERSRSEIPNAFVPLGTGHLDYEQHGFDVVHPFFDPAMLDDLPDSELLDLSQFGPLPMSLYDLELGDWTVSSVGPSGTRSAF